MAKIAIREDNVLAIETRSGLFVIAQALKNKTLVFFNLFTATPLSFTANLNSAKFLCCITPTKAFFERVNIIKIKISPAENIEHYRLQDRLAFYISNHLKGRKNVTVYAGTTDEITIPSMATGDELRLIAWRSSETLRHLSKEDDKNLIDEHQLDMMGEYGELNERLYLSYRYNKFVEPVKEMVMGNVLPTYKVYFQILAGRISEDEYMKLPIEEVLY